MGSFWSDEALRESNERLAYEDLDGLVWDISRSVTHDAVENSLRLHGVHDWYSAERLCKKFKNLEAEQVGKYKFFYNRNVEDLYVFHCNMSARYGCVVSNLILCSIKLR